MHLFPFIFPFLINNVFCFFKTFNYHTDITNPDLWVGHQKSKDCSGVIFTRDFHNVYIKHLKAAQVLLPQHGSIYIIDGGYLEINADLSNSCIKIDEIPLHSYYNPSSWAMNNPSIPSIERIPCTHDEVMFPYALNSPVIFDDKIDLKMRHLVMDDTVIYDAYEFDHFLESGQWPVTAYAKPEVYFTKTQCEDESGCVCHEWRGQKEVCRYIRGLSGGDGSGGDGCLQAIEPPIGECSVSSFCGGVLHIKPKTGFNLRKLEKLLEDYYLSADTVAAYASKVAADEHTRLIQVVFAEDKYTGKSAEVAKDFFKKLTMRQMMEELKMADVKLYASGAAIVVGETAAAVVGMIFGTLLAVAVVFAAIYVCYVGPLKDYNFSKSFPSRPLTKTFGGVRYKSKDEEQLVYEGQSMAGSILSLDRAFDNPMYGQQTSASTSTGETTVIQEQKLQENPMYKAAADDFDQIKNVDSEI